MKIDFNDVGDASGYILMECSECGSIVENTVLHRKWHMQLDSRFAL